MLPLDQQAAFVRLRPTVIAGGLGGHKWLDRRLLAELARSMALDPDEQLLIEDADGEVLETDRANIFAVIDGVLHTTPADGRLLPGVTRDAVLRAAGVAGLGVSVTPVTMRRLQAATEVFVTNSVSGVRPVRSVTGQHRAAWPAARSPRAWRRPSPGGRPDAALRPRDARTAAGPPHPRTAAETPDARTAAGPWHVSPGGQAASARWSS